MRARAALRDLADPRRAGFFLAAFFFERGFFLAAFFRAAFFLVPAAFRRAAFFRLGLFFRLAFFRLAGAMAPRGRASWDRARSVASQ